jgi:hypothetical protein
VTVARPVQRVRQIPVMQPGPTTEMHVRIPYQPPQQAPPPPPPQPQLVGVWAIPPGAQMPPGMVSVKSPHKHKRRS